MNRNNRNIEDLFRTLFEQFTVNPTPGLWKNIQGKIAWKQFLSFGLNSFNVYYLALIIALGGAGAYFMLSRNDLLEISDNNITIPSAQAIPPEPTRDQVIPRFDHISAAAKEPGSVGSRPLKKTASEPAPATGTRQQKSTHKTIPINNTADQETVSKATETPKAQTLSSKNGSAAAPEIIPASIDFKADPLSGCSPLAVNFQNLSENASGITWNFGDGGNSDESNPSYVFDEPGEFLVTLKVLGKDGLEYSRQQTVQVFETPKALFEFEEDVKPAMNQPIYFYNYSRGGQYYEWDFGDNQRSVVQEPIHFYDGPGNYHVRLKVWNDHQCYDSMVIFNAFTTREQNIKVPNVFTPNLNGPTGGYYDVNDINNTVFHPVTNVELLEFQFKVFSRNGVLLFESSDISIGWDGYYNEELMKQDVYIWKIRGKYNNGKTFVESGDVTLIKQH
jgi:gliding motility-associated-like protein